MGRCPGEEKERNRISGWNARVQAACIPLRTDDRNGMMLTCCGRPDGKR